MLGIVRLTIIAGLIFLGLGFVFSLLPELPHFPGDIFCQKENFTFYFPIITCLVISGIITAILWFTKKI